MSDADESSSQDNSQVRIGGARPIEDSSETESSSNNNSYSEESEESNSEEARIRDESESDSEDRKNQIKIKRKKAFQEDANIYYIENFKEKPWRDPNITLRDHTSYFNYGFDEITWRLYCRIRNGTCKYIGKGPTVTNQAVAKFGMENTMGQNQNVSNYKHMIDRVSFDFSKK